MSTDPFPQAAPRAALMRRALFATNLLNEPLCTLYGLIAFILYKDLGASPFHISLLMMLKPVITIFSFYWSAGVSGKKLKGRLLWAGFWMRAPFLLCLWCDSIWYLIGCAVNYMFFYRAAIPPWIEMVKQNLEKGERERAFSWSSALGYAEGILLSMGVGALLDRDPALWKPLLVGASLMGLSTLWFQRPINLEEGEPLERVDWKGELLRPWRDSLRLLKERPDFRSFQWAFMICGFGIMVVQPAIPLFAVDVLGISYLEILGGISLAKGLGFALSSPFWARFMERGDLFAISRAVFFAVALFPLFLCFSVGGMFWFYLAHFWYGVGQGGSHLVWSLSGLSFAEKEESSRYTAINVALAGVRGMFAPPLGGWLSAFFGPLSALLLGGSLCLYSALRLFEKKKVVSAD